MWFLWKLAICFLGDHGSLIRKLAMMVTKINTFFYHDNRKVTLVSLSPKEVCDYQSIMRERKESKREKKVKKRKKKKKKETHKIKKKRKKKKEKVEKRK